MSSSQYTAKAHIDILKNNNISISMDGKGRSIDNIVIERFWRSLKYEDIYPNSYSTIKEARKGIDEYINIYNKQRLHSQSAFAPLLIIVLLMKFIIKELIISVMMLEK